MKKQKGEGMAIWKVVGIIIALIGGIAVLIAGTEMMGAWGDTAGFMSILADLTAGNIG